MTPKGAQIRPADPQHARLPLEESAHRRVLAEGDRPRVGRRRLVHPVKAPQQVAPERPEGLVAGNVGGGHRHQRSQARLRAARFRQRRGARHHRADRRVSA